MATTRRLWPSRSALRAGPRRGPPGVRRAPHPACCACAPGPDARACAARYGYYFASSAGVRVSQRVKKAVTIAQLVQVRPGPGHPLALLFLFCEG